MPSEAQRASLGWVKICGVTSVSDARLVAACRPDALGLNFCAGSPRRVSEETARAIVEDLGGGIEMVGVFVNAPLDELLRVSRQVGLDAVQLHGDESPDFLLQVRSAGISAFKAVRVGSREDAFRAESFEGPRILVDAKVAGVYGGSGEAFDWSLIEELNRKRDLILAGGLGPETVAGAIRAVRPGGVDTASGVESAPGQKDPEKVRLFVESARRAFQSAS